MAFQVKVCTRVDTLHFFETEREFVLYIRGGIRVVSQFLVVVETLVIVSEAESLVPTHTGLFPFLEPVQF